MADVEAELTKRRDTCVTNGSVVQPLTVIVGKTLEEIEEIFVLINSIRYTFSSLIRAFDFTFKCFYSLQLDYPRDSQYP